MQIIQIPINDIKSYKNNAKKHPDEQINHIANSIKSFGFKQPLVIDKDNNIVAGHGRLLAAVKLGMSEVPCIIADDLTPEEIQAYRLADNKTNESPWDFELLDLELKDIFDIDMADFGFLDIDNENLLLEKTELKPYKKVHYLISLDLNLNDKLIPFIDEIKSIVGVEIESTLN